MKKVISLLLAAVLLLGMLPVTALAAAAEPEADSNGVYQIGTAEQLLWFAEAVNSGNTAISGVLTADIDLSEMTGWPGIGSSDFCFAGSFDGQGHTVTFEDADWGLFGYVKGSNTAVATVKNVKTKGSIHASGIAHVASFACVENCINGATITANKARTAGVVGHSIGVQQGNGTTANDVKIINCGNEASVTGLSSIGGILGWANVNTRVENCYNTGNINGKECVGGIAGYLQASFRGATYVKNSYNTGTVTGTENVAGIVGDAMNTVEIINTYNAGNAHYAIAGNVYNNSVKITNCYFLGTASAKSTPDYTWYTGEELGTRATAVSGQEMGSEAVAALLGSAFKVSCPYPVLSWQTAKEHSGAVCSNCKLGSTAKEIYDVTFQEHPGYILNGEPNATQGEAYTFTISINDGYEKVAGFAVKINGQEITPASDGKYTVLEVEGPLSVTVKNVQTIPGNHVISLPGEGYGYRVTGERSAKRDENYSFELTFVDGFKAGGDFKVVAQEILPQSELNKGTKPEEKTLTGQDGTYTITTVQKDYRILISGVVAVPTVAPVTVNFTVTEGWYDFHEPNDSGEVVMDMELTVPYFDLSLYGLEKYYYNPYCYLDEHGNIRNIQQKGTPETAYNNITVMHAFIVATELYYLGYSQKEVGTGVSYKADPGAFQQAISWSQDAGSSFMNFWDHGTNLNYYVNYQYPLAYAGWGATSDQIKLQSGDILSVHMITGQGSGSNFGFFTANDTNSKYNHGTDIVNEITVDQGEKVKLTHYWTSTSGSYTTSYKVQANKQLYWIAADDLTDNEADVRSWGAVWDAENEEYVPQPFGKNDVLKTDSSGVVTINTAGLEPGTYYIGAIGGFEAGGGKDDAGFESSGYEAGAAFFRLTVKEYKGKLGDLDNDTDITAKDATMILQCVAGTVSDINEGIADVDNDGYVTSKDATMILQYVAGTLDSLTADED